MQPENIDMFYKNSNSIRSRSNAQQDDAWNMGEHGIGLGVCNNSLVWNVKFTRESGMAYVRLWFFKGKDRTLSDRVGFFGPLAPFSVFRPTCLTLGGRSHLMTIGRRGESQIEGRPARSLG